MFENEYTYGKAIENNLISDFNEKFEKATDDVLNELEQDCGKNLKILRTYRL